MQMSSQVASQGGHYGIDWPEVIGEAGCECVCVCARTDEATTVFLLVNLSEYSVYDNEHGVPREIQFVAVAGELQNLCSHLGEDLEVNWV